jgi:hypothetical protein
MNQTQLERARRQRHEAGERPAAIGVEPDMVEEGAVAVGGWTSRRCAPSSPGPRSGPSRASSSSSAPRSRRGRRGAPPGRSPPGPRRGGRSPTGGRAGSSPPVPPPLADRGVDIATLCAVITRPEERTEPSVVKLVGSEIAPPAAARASRAARAGSAAAPRSGRAPGGDRRRARYDTPHDLERARAVLAARRLN